MGRRRCVPNSVARRDVMYHAAVWQCVRGGAGLGEAGWGDAAWSAVWRGWAGLGVGLEWSGWGELNNGVGGVHRERWRRGKGRWRGRSGGEERREL